MVVAASDIRVYRDASKGLGELPLVAQPLQIVTRVKAGCFSGCVAFAIPELNLFAVGEEDKWITAELGFDSVRIVSGLAFSSELIARGSFGLDYSNRFAI